MRLALVLLTAITCAIPAQLTDDLAAFFPVETHPDLFYEATLTQEGWGETTGWIHQHWTGEWEDGGITRTLMVSTFADPELRLPPVMSEMTIRASNDGLALVRQRLITAELEDEVTDFPENHWVLPRLIAEGQSWTSEWPDNRSWSQITALDVPNPNPVIEVLASGETCTQIMSVLATRRTSGAVALQITESWLLPGFGPVKTIEHTGVVWEPSWDNLPVEALAGLVDRRESLPRRAILMLVPPAGMSY